MRERGERRRRGTRERGFVWYILYTVIYLHIRLYTFIYLHIPPNAFIYFHIPPYTSKHKMIITRTPEHPQGSEFDQNLPTMRSEQGERTGNFGLTQAMISQRKCMKTWKSQHVQRVLLWLDHCMVNLWESYAQKLCSILPLQFELITVRCVYVRDRNLTCP